MQEYPNRQTSHRPNFVFVFADDWGWGDLGCYGHDRIQTPNLDKLAQQGALYTRFHVASAVCSPSRAAVLTGQYPAKLKVHGHFANHGKNVERGMPDHLDTAYPTYTRCFQEAGYRVGHYGKWHLGHDENTPEPFEYGIDECRINVGNGPQLSFGSDGFMQYKLVERHRSSEVIIDETIGFIERNQDSPFLANVWLNDTHAILDPDDKQLEPYQHLMPREVSDKHKGALAIYYAAVTNADKHIGRLMDRLEAMGLAENTVFIFSADNGPEDMVINASHSAAGSAGPLRGRKRSLYNGGVRVPFILRWPAGQTQADVVDDTSVICAVDLFPTFCSIAGIPLPEDNEIDGENLEDVFRGAQRDRKKPLFWEWRFGIGGHVFNRSPSLSVYDDGWKLLMNADRSRVELYKVGEDEREMINRAEDHPEIVDTLSKKALAWQETLPDGPWQGCGSDHYPWPGENDR